MARAFGSYPKCRRFKSYFRYHIWPGGQAVKTPPFHGGNTGSIPVRVTKDEVFPHPFFFLYIIKLLKTRFFTFIYKYATITRIKNVESLN